MTKDNSTGKNKEFYDLGKKMFDRIQVLPEHQAMIQRGVDRTTPPFKPDWNTEAVLVEEMQRMAKRIEELEALAQPEQEPVLWMMPDGKTADKWALQFYGGQVGKPLYTSPPQREWVGLTDDEQQQAYEQWQNEGWGVFYRAIEAKLKEKNT